MKFKKQKKWRSQKHFLQPFTIKNQKPSLWTKTKIHSRLLSLSSQVMLSGLLSSSLLESEHSLFSSPLCTIVFIFLWLCLFHMQLEAFSQTLHSKEFSHSLALSLSTSHLLFPKQFAQSSLGQCFSVSSFDLDPLTLWSHLSLLVNLKKKKEMRRIRSNILWF